jgi:hypothetical protein
LAVSTEMVAHASRTGWTGRLLQGAILSVKYPGRVRDVFIAWPEAGEDGYGET